MSSSKGKSARHVFTVVTRESYSVGNPLRIYVVISGSVRGWPIEASKSEYCLAFR
jgi:hypothetical protein